jgi:hypothetical protein
VDYLDGYFGVGERHRRNPPPDTHKGETIFFIPEFSVHLLRVGWKNFILVVVLCQFLVLAGNRFWFYIHMYLEYNAVVVLC